MTLSEKIAYCRKKAGLSQEELAAQVGVSRQAVSKWELGDAVPEVGKLLALAKAFGVTTDWLLSEDDPAPETGPAPKEGPAPDAAAEEAPPPAAHTWVDSVPGVIGRLLRQYGWLFGVRMAIGGGVFTVFGFVMQAVMGSLNRTADRFMAGSYFGDLGGVVWTDEAGHVLGQFGGASAPDPGSIISGFVIAVGLISLIAGIVIAVNLYPKRKNKDQN